jgi:hypothetical protein
VYDVDTECFLITGCGSDEAALVAAQFDNVLPGTCGEGGPKVDSATPANGEVDMPLTTTITAYFDEAMDPTSIAYDDPNAPQVVTFTLYDNDYPGVSIPGTVAMSLLDFAATFTPTDVLEGGTTYTAIITTYAQNKDLVHLGCSYKWEFETITP